MPSFLADQRQVEHSDMAASSVSKSKARVSGEVWHTPSSCKKYDTPIEQAEAEVPKRDHAATMISTGHTMP